jgi:hypothetical protein
MKRLNKMLKKYIIKRYFHRILKKKLAIARKADAEKSIVNALTLAKNAMKIATVSSVKISLFLNPNCFIMKRKKKKMKFRRSRT